MRRASLLVVTAVLACAALVTPSVVQLRPRLLWNASASAPIGLYLIEAITFPRRGELVVVRPPDDLAVYLAARGYLPTGVPLLKHVAAINGSRICRSENLITVDGMPVARALPRDRHGRPLPVWSGCQIVRQGQVLLLNGERRDSLDGRYFGVLPSSAVVGAAVPIWTKLP